MDRDNFRGAQRRQPAGAPAKLVMFMSYVPGTKEKDVPGIIFVSVICATLFTLLCLCRSMVW
jgi:hypothetical protein